MAIPYLPFAMALGEFVPLISRWLGGPESEAQAKKIVSVAQKVTGFADRGDMLGALRRDPAMVASLQNSILEIEAELEKAIHKDRESARLRDIALIQAGRSNLRADIMVCSAAFGLVACLASIAVFKQSLPGEAVGIISTIAGIFGSCLKDAYAFEFGSSRGSKQKDYKINELLGGNEERKN